MIPPVAGDIRGGYFLFRSQLKTASNVSDLGCTRLAHGATKAMSRRD